MCNCSTMCRIPDMETENDGTRCVMEPHEAASVLKEAEEDEYEEFDYKVSTVMITRDQFNKLEEFTGF
jgi:hypothetical protein